MPQDFGGRAVDPHAGHAEGLGAGEPGESQQSLASAATGHLTERHLRQTERRGLGDDPEVAGEAELERPAVTMTVDGRRSRVAECARAPTGSRSRRDIERGVMSGNSRTSTPAENARSLADSMIRTRSHGWRPRPWIASDELVAVVVLEDVQFALSSDVIRAIPSSAALGDAKEPAHGCVEPLELRELLELCIEPGGVPLDVDDGALVLCDADLVAPRRRPRAGAR